jgi:hypothetical protein
VHPERAKARPGLDQGKVETEGLGGIAGIAHARARLDDGNLYAANRDKRPAKSKGRLSLSVMS